MPLKQVGRTLCMSYKNLYRGEINIPQTVKPFTQSQRYTVFSIISFTDAIVNCSDAVYIYGRRSSRKDWNILCLQEKSQFPCLAHPQMSITRKIKNIKEKILTQLHLCTKLRQTHTSYLWGKSFLCSSLLTCCPRTGLM